MTNDTFNTIGNIIDGNCKSGEIYYLFIQDDFQGQHLHNLADQSELPELLRELADKIEDGRVYPPMNEN